MQRCDLDHLAFATHRLYDLRQGVLVHRSAAGEEAPAAKILRAIEEPRAGGAPIAAGAPDLLVVGVDRPARLVMGDEADVRLVDPHAERRRTDHDIDSSVHEPLADRLP